MPSGRKIMEWLTLSFMDPRLVLAQYKEVRRRIPFLYTMLCVNLVGFSFTHKAVAPLIMTQWIPGALIILCCVRGIHWKRQQNLTFSAEQALYFLRRTNVLAAVLAVVYMSWALLMNSYGGDREHILVAMFVTSTAITVIFCFMHLPQAAVIVATIVIVPFLGFYLHSGDAVDRVIAINLLLVLLVILSVLRSNYRGFQTLIAMHHEADRLNREIMLSANTDVLTGLPNRRLFFLEVETKIEDHRRRGSDLSLGLIDLDRFKAVNDTFGHILGDQLLEAVGARLLAIFGSTGLVARLGGDEFAFVVSLSGPDAQALGNEACRALSETFQLGDVTVSIGGSCGVAVADGSQSTARSLYDKADQALYASKTHRRGSTTIYSADRAHDTGALHMIEAAVRSADFARDMDVHFQPIVRIEDGKVIAVEALARWTSDGLGSVGPDVFIPIAERLGVINLLTPVLFRKSLDHFQGIPSDIKLSFNLSAHDLVSRETTMALVSMIRLSGIDPSRIIFELTETAVVADFAAAKDCIRLLRLLGVKIALDDFGTGQSSLSYLLKLDVDKVKIDRSFVAGATEPGGHDLLTAIVTLCHSMKRKCIAEGVENHQQLEFLKQIGCDAFQGYLLAKPMPIQDLVAWLAAPQRHMDPPGYDIRCEGLKSLRGTG